MPPELLSRFRVLTFRRYGEADFLEVCRRVLVQREGLSVELAERVGPEVSRRARAQRRTPDPREARDIGRLLRDHTGEELTRLLATIDKYR